MDLTKKIIHLNVAFVENRINQVHFQGQICDLQ